MTNQDYIQYLDNLNDLYIDDYRGRTGRNGKGNISCIYASQTHAKGTDNKPSMGYMAQSKKYHCNTCNKVAGLIDLVKADNNFVTNYSKNSLSEDFADSVAFYLTDIHAFLQPLKLSTSMKPFCFHD